MQGLVRFCHAILFSTLSALAAAQPVSVTVGDPPFIMNGAVSAFADITITENFPDALHDGYFALYFAENPDQRVVFQPGSTAEGSVAGIAVQGAPGASALVVQVDADDGALDSITVHPVAEIDFYDESYFFRNGLISFQLGDQPTLHGWVPAGDDTGLGSAQGGYALGIFGGAGGIGIGDAPAIELEVGETAVLALTHSHPAHIIVESFHPAIAAVLSHSLSSVEIAGAAPGEALIQAWNPIGESGYLNVTVTDVTIPPEEQLQLLIDEVAALVPADLRAGQARALNAKLRAALRSLARGNTAAACRQVAAFIGEVEALVRAGRLDAVLGSELIASAELVRDALGC